MSMPLCYNACSIIGWVYVMGVSTVPLHASISKRYRFLNHGFTILWPQRSSINDPCQVGQCGQFICAHCVLKWFPYPNVRYQCWILVTESLVSQNNIDTSVFAFGESSVSAVIHFQAFHQASGWYTMLAATRNKVYLEALEKTWKQHLIPPQAWGCCQLGLDRLRRLPQTIVPKRVCF